MTKHPELRYGTPQEAGMRPDRVERAREIAASSVKKGLTPSLAVLAARRGVIPLHEAFGQMRPGPDAPPLVRDAIFPITSATKPITATLAMMLAEDGLLSTSRPAVDYLPELEGEEIDLMLVHHLLTHTSGYDDMVIFPILLQTLKGEEPTDWSDVRGVGKKMFEACRAAHRTRKPGEEMMYSNHNYLLLGMIIERVSGQPLEEFARERLFGPLGMKDTDYVLRDDMRERLLQRPMDAPLSETLIIFPGIESEFWQQSVNGGSGCYSTPMDLAIFGQMFLNGGSYGNTRILSRPTVADMSRNQIPGIGATLGSLSIKEACYGYGWMVPGSEKWRYFSPSIGSPGAYVHSGAGGINLWIDPMNELVVVYMEVTMKITANLEPVTWSFDYFHGALISALDD